MKKKFVLVFWLIWAAFSIFLVAKSFEKEAIAIPLSQEKLSDELRVMSWNLGSYCKSSRYFEGKYYKSSPKPESQRKKIAKTIGEINPDILCIQEIGTDYFGVFLKELELANLRYPYSALLENLDKNRCIAILSKQPFEKLTKYDNVKFPYENGTFESVRGLLLAKLNGVFVATLHAKSRRSFEAFPADKNCEIYRERELAAFAKILAHYKDEKLLLCGDFNEEPSHANIKNFHTKASLKQIPQGTSSKDSWTYSYKSGKYTNTFDFFLATPKIHTKKPAQILSDYKQASDHRPIYIDIELN